MSSTKPKPPTSNDEDEVDLDGCWEEDPQRETETAWSRATRLATTRPNRAFGKGLFRIRKKDKPDAAPLLGRAVSCSDPRAIDSGYLVDDNDSSSPDFKDFSSTSSQLEQDPFFRLSPEKQNEENAHINRSRHALRRSNSLAIPLPPNPKRQTRRLSTASASATSRSSSAASSTGLEPPRLRHSRSNSFLHSPSSSFNPEVYPPPPVRTRQVRANTFGGRDSSVSSSDDFAYGEFPGSDAADDLLGFFESGGEMQQRERKKIRGRCKSIDANVVPLSLATHMNSSSSEHLLQCKQEWKSIESSPPPKYHDHNSNNKDQQLPSPARSVASSRKRGVDGSPLVTSDQEDWSSSGCGGGDNGMDASNNSSSSMLRTTRTRSRSRVYSPPPTMPQPLLFGQAPPIPPPLPFAVGGTCSLGSGGRATNSSPDDHLTREGNVMDIDDSDDENAAAGGGEDGGAASDRDTSFESTSHNHHHRHSSSALQYGYHNYHRIRLVESEQDVLNTMPLYEDLKFAIISLRRESSSRLNNFCYGGAGRGAGSWNMTPPAKWESMRRTNFLQWATRHLGFTLRAAGGATTFLQIPKRRGVELLRKLEGSRNLYKQQQLLCGNNDEANSRNKDVEAEPPVAVLQVPTTTTSTIEDEPVTFMELSYSATKKNPPPSSTPHAIHVVESMSTYSFVDELTSDLTSQMNTLSIKEADNNNNSYGLPKMTRYVTLEQEHTDNKNNVPPPRASLENGAAPNMSSSDLMFQLLQGDQKKSPPEVSSYQKPPRSSTSSFVISSSRLSTGLASVKMNQHSQRRGSAPFVPTSISTTSCIGAAPSFDVLETPLMKQDDCWGSCPVEGRDWGESLRCSDSGLNELWDQFNKSRRQAGLGDESLDDECCEARLAEPGCSQLMFDMGEEVLDSQLSLGEAGAAGERVSFRQVKDPEVFEKDERRRRLSIEKYRRRSIFYSAFNSTETDLIQPAGLFKRGRTLLRTDEHTKSSSSFGSDSFPITSQELVRVVSVSESSDPSADSQIAPPVFSDEAVLSNVFAFLTEIELLHTASRVCTVWADTVATAHANLMLASIGCFNQQHDEDEDDEGSMEKSQNSIAASMERDWRFLNSLYPWGQYLSEGGMKKVYKVYNKTAEAEEAVSVMDIDSIIDKRMLGAELAVSCLLSSFPRRGICPNFVLTRGVFTCPYDAPASQWGCAENKRPRGNRYDPGCTSRLPREPAKKHRGNFQYIRMEFCNQGDVEEYIKRQNDRSLAPLVAQGILFQAAFALHAAADRFSVKHYDMKLLNIFLQQLDVDGDLILRYGLGAHFFAVRMPKNASLIAKVADYGTSDIKPSSNGQPVTLAQFTTLENTPPDFMVLGDMATQGHGHDCFALGLCMLHLFTGEEPYEEILTSVKCPPALKKKLRSIFEDDNVHGYDTIRSVILQDVYMDEAGHILEGEPDLTLYDTLYRYLVLFGIPEDKFDRVRCPLVWDAIEEMLEGKVVSMSQRNKTVKRKNAPDSSQFARDKKKFSVREGKNKYIERARKKLEKMPGGMALLLRLCSFDPSKRASAMDVLNSTFMENLRERDPNALSLYGQNDKVYTYAAFSTATNR